MLYPAMFVSGAPKPKGSWTATKSGKFRPSGKGWGKWFKHGAEEVKKQWKGPLLEGPIEVYFFFLLPRPKTVKRLWPVSKYDGDWDKLARAAGDFLTGTAIVDDSQIVRGRIEKQYAGKGWEGVYIEVKDLS